MPVPDTSWTHRDMADLLGGDLSPAARARWPVEARDHAAGCAECQTILRSDALVRDELSCQPLGPAPTLDQLRARLAARRPAPPEAFLAHLPPFPAGALLRFRDTSPDRLRLDPAPAALSLQRLNGGIVALDPFARQVSLFAFPPGEPPLLLASGAGQEGAYAHYDGDLPARTHRIGALALSGPVDPEMLSLWLADVLRPDPARALEDALAGAPDRLRVVELDLRTERLSPDQIRIRPGPLPPALPELQALTIEARQAGVAERLDESGRLYRLARDRAREAGDALSEVKGAIGLSYVLGRLGFDREQEDVLRELLSRQELDAYWASWVGSACRLLAVRREDLQDAERWDRLARLRPDMNHDFHSLLLAYRRRDWPAVLAHIDAPWMGQYGPEWLVLAEARIVEALVNVGRLDEAQARAARMDALLGQVRATDVYAQKGLPPEWALARLLLQRALGQPMDWGAAFREIDREESFSNEGYASTASVTLFRDLLELALERGEQRAARRLVRLCFLPTPEAPADQPAVLGVLERGEGGWILDPEPGAAIRPLTVSPAKLRALSVLAQAEVLSGRADGAAVARLAEILFPRGFSPDVPLLVGARGLLSGAPLPAILAHAQPGAPLPPVREVVGPRRFHSTLASPAGSIVSLADSLGDLPAAREEIRPDEAAVYLRGEQVTAAALRGLPADTSLLHLGVHAHRERGVPVLDLADALLGPVEIASLRLPNRPVVLLSGCATALGAREQGIELSFAQAFLQAGASAVIATRWPVRDDEMALLVRRLVARWPSADLGATVASICDDLRREGYPARLWASLVLY